jgi:glycerol-3-phosphate acyltransferase PlsY
MSDIGLSPGVAWAIVVTVFLIFFGLTLAAFLIGSIPFGYIIGRVFYGTDIRRQGSGNIGAMNALRTMGKGGAIAVLLLDALKGFIPAFLTLWWFKAGGAGHLDIDFDPNFPPGAEILAALIATAAVLGHCYSPWLRFRGGKGVATFFGALFGLCWPAGIVAVLGWVAGAALTRYSSVGSILGSVLAPIAVFACSRSLPETAFALFAAAIVILKHRDNIARLRAGTEGPIHLSK